MDSSEAKTPPFILGLWGVRSGQGRSAVDHVLYADAGFPFGHAKSACIRTSFYRRTQADLERPRGIGLAATARWPRAGTRRLEQGDPPSEGFARLHCRT